MNFYLDENVPKPIERFLSSEGHSIFSTRDTEYESADNKTSFRLVQDKSAIFITTDKDFFHTVPFLFKNHCGLS
jgi:predicted nuclease of predicted toxin-antitoxin system